MTCRGDGPVERGIRGNLSCHGRSRHDIPDPQLVGDAAVRNIAAPTYTPRNPIFVCVLLSSSPVSRQR